MSSFTITTPAATVNVSPSSVKSRDTAKGTATYQITNKTGATIRTALRVVPGTGTDAAWFKVREGEERDVGPGKTEDFSIDLSVPGSAANREIPDEKRPKLSFHAVAVNLKNPDNDFETGGAVAFQAPGLEQTDSWFKWWMVAAPIALILIVVGAFFVIRALLAPGPLLADWTSKPVDDARHALEAQGAQVSERHPSDLGPASVDAARFYQRIVQSQNPPADGARKVKGGTTVELTWEWKPNIVTVPDLNGQTLPNAIPLLEQAGLRFVAAQDPPQPEQPNSYIAVKGWNPSGSVNAGTGITLTMGWQERRKFGVGEVAGVKLQDEVRVFQQLKSQESPQLMRRGVPPQ